MDKIASRKRIVDTDVVSGVTSTRQSVITRVVIWFLWHDVIHWITATLYDKRESQHQHHLILFPRFCVFVTPSSAPCSYKLRNCAVQTLTLPCLPEKKSRLFEYTSQSMHKHRKLRPARVVRQLPRCALICSKLPFLCYLFYLIWFDLIWFLFLF